MTFSDVFTNIKVETKAIILSILLFLGVTTPTMVSADKKTGSTGGAGGIGDLTVGFTEEGGASITGGGFGDKNDSVSVWNQIITEFHTQIAAVFGVFMLIALYKFGELLVKLIMSSDNPRGRGEIITGMVVAGGATAALGAATILFGFFYHLLL